MHENLLIKDNKIEDFEDDKIWKLLSLILF